MIFCSVCSSSHLPRAMVMASSVKEHMPTSKVIIGLLEEKLPDSVKDFPHFDEIILVKDMGVYRNFYKFIFQYDVKEGAGSSKGQVLKYVYDKYANEDIFIYLDTDMKVMGPFYEIIDLLRTQHLIVTGRHYLPPVNFNVKAFRLYRHFGMYNSGFVALKRHPLSEKFIQWWTNRLESLGYFNRKQGIFSDQTWIDFAALYFNAYVLLHPGYNVGPWNFSERHDIKETVEGFSVNGFPLRCFHFSLLDSYYLKMLKRVPVQFQAGLLLLRNRYINELRRYETKEFKHIKWSYDFFRNGSKILTKTRLRYRSNPKFMKVDNPFRLSNKFFIRKRKVVSKLKVMQKQRRGRQKKKR